MNDFMNPRMWQTDREGIVKNIEKEKDATCELQMICDWHKISVGVGPTKITEAHMDLDRINSIVESREVDKRISFAYGKIRYIHGNDTIEIIASENKGISLVYQLNLEW